MKSYVYKINIFKVLGYHYRGMMTVYNLRNHPSDKIQEVGNWGMKYIEQRELKKAIVEFKWTELGAKRRYTF